MDNATAFLQPTVSDYSRRFASFRLKQGRDIVGILYLFNPKASAVSSSSDQPAFFCPYRAFCMQFAFKMDASRPINTTSLKIRLLLRVWDSNPTFSGFSPSKMATSLSPQLEMVGFEPTNQVPLCLTTWLHPLVHPWESNPYLWRRTSVLPLN